MHAWIQALLARLWALLFIASSVYVAFHALGYLFRDFNPGNPFHVSFSVSGVWVPMHFFGAGLALLIAPLQLSGRLRARWPSLHRTGGWLYVLAVAAGGVSGIALAPQAQGGWAVGASFLLLGPLWLAATGLALFHALQGRNQDHRRWMLRSVAMTFAAATLRLYLGVGIAGLGLDFATAYWAAAWLCWPVNLLLVELYLRSAARPLPRRGVGTHSAFHPADA